MNSLRRWLYRPKQSDSSLLAQFYFADEELNFVAAELDSFEGRKDPERCTTLINQLRACQARVLNVISQMMDDAVKGQRAPRDFRVKFPDDVIQDNLAGQLWFGAECLAAGSSIMNREVESAAMRPLARALTKNLDSLRSILREQCLHNVHEYTEEIKESLIIFDKLFAEFELSYVSAMVPVKSAHEYDMIQEITVLFSETVQRSLKSGHLTREMIDEYDPALMFTIPRLAIVCGVLIFNDGPLNPDNDPWNISEMFRPFQTLLLKIRELLTILTDEERNTLERALCSQEEPSFLISLEGKKEKRKNDEKPSQKSGGNKKCEGDGDDGSVESELTALEIAERLEALASSFVASRNGEGSKQAAGSENSEKRSKDAEETSSASMSSDSVEDIEGLNQGPEEESIMDSGCRVAAEGGRGSDSAVDQQNQASNPAELASAFVQEIDVIDSPNSDKRDTEHSENAPCAESDDGGISKHDTVSSSDMKRFSLNKCDSHDSGLHSEALSTSGSMLMISSSDSSHLIGSSDMPLSSTSLCSDAAGQTSPSTATTDITEIDCNATSQPIVSSTCNTSPSVSESLDSSHTMVPDSGASEQSASPTIVSGKAEGESLFKKEIQDTCVAVEEPVVSVSSHSQQRRDSSAETIQSVLCIPKYCNSNETTVDAKELGSVKCESSEVNENMNACSSSEVMCSLNSDCIKVQEDEECSTEEFSEDRGGPQMDEKMGINQMCSDLAHSIVSNAVLASLVTSNHSQDNQTVILQAQCASNDVKGESSQANSSSGYTSEDSPSTSSSCNTPKESSGKSFSDAQKLESPSLAVEGAVGDDNNANSGTDVSLSHSCAGAESKSQVPASQSGEKSSGENPVSHVVTEVRTENSTAKTGAESASENSAAVPSTSKSAASIGAHGPSDTVVHKPPRGTHKKKSSSKSQKSSSTRRRRQEEGAASSYSRDQGICSVQNTAKRIMDAHLLDSDCCNSSETSSYTSDCGDQEEIALAIEAAESATRDQVRARFRSSSDMIHRLFVCISGVADQLQTNFAGDLRNILRAVFDMNCSEPIDVSDNDKSKDLTPLGAAYRAISNASRTSRRRRHSSHARQEPPRWIPDEECNACMACQVPFTFVRRRHHCRNCGKIFCSRCSSNFVPLPHFGQDKAVRVCNRCFMFRVTPFTVRPS